MDRGCSGRDCWVGKPALPPLLQLPEQLWRRLWRKRAMQSVKSWMSLMLLLVPRGKNDVTWPRSCLWHVKQKDLNLYFETLYNGTTFHRKNRQKFYFGEWRRLRSVPSAETIRNRPLGLVAITERRYWKYQRNQFKISSRI